MRLSKTSLRKLDKYIDLLSFMHLYIAIKVGDDLILHFTRFLQSVPFNTAYSIQVYNSDLDTLYKEFYSLNSFLRYYSSIYKNRFFITRNNYAYEREIH